MTQDWTSEKDGGAEQRMRIASKGRVLTGVKTHFSAAHRCQETGQIHGHTWEVTVWFNNPSRCDARILKAQIENDLAQWDHGILPDEFAWAEDICLDLAKRMNVAAVEVARPSEGLFARFELSPLIDE
jgi:6-pyruvoyl-tetrahydropterin synthase